MPWLELIGLVILSRAELTAWLLVRERPYYRPLAWLLAADFFSVLAGLAMRHGYLAVQPRPYVGLARVLFHGEQLAGLVWPVGVASVALVVLARRSPWPAFLAGAVALAARVALYPWLRAERLAVALLVEQVALVALGAWAWRRFSRDARPVRPVRDELWEAPVPWLQEHHKAVGVILLAELVLLFGPHLVGISNGDGLRITPGNPFEKWGLAQILYSSLFVWLAIMQRRWRCKATAS